MTSKARALLVASCASLLSLVSAATLLVGALGTLFSFSPGTDVADRYVLARVGPPLLAGGLYGMRLGGRLWRLRKPSDSPQADVLEPFSSPLRELAWAAALVAVAFGGTWFLLLSPPWSSTAITLYAGYNVAKVVPLRLFLGVLVPLLAIRLLPRLAALSLTRQLFSPVQVAALATAGAASMALLAYAHFAGVPAMPHTVVLRVLDVTLGAVFAVVAIESVTAAAPRS